MAIVKMKHLHLVAMDDDREELLRMLQRMGCVEVEEPTVDPEDPVLSALTRAQAEGLATAKEEQSGAERALGVLKRYAPAKESFLAPKPVLGEGELFDIEGAAQARAAAEEINQAERRIAAIQSEEAKLSAQKLTLAPWLPMNMALDTESTEQVTIQLGTLPLLTPFAQAEAEVKSTGELAQLSLISADRESQYCLLVCHNSQWEQVEEKLKAQGWSRANLREWAGTAAENTANINKTLENLAGEQAELKQKLSSLGEKRTQLRRLADLSAVEAGRAENRGKLLDTSKTFLLEGWVPAENWEELKKALEAYPAAYEVTDPDPEDYGKVPVRLKNNKLTKPLNMVTEMYSLPAYGSLDPNPLMAPFFILFYGIMMADMGYGLLMLLAGLVVLKKKKPGGTFGHMAGLLVLCGISTFIMGAVTGGFFGDFLTQFFRLTGIKTNFALPALFNPLDDTMMILIGAMCLGAVQIITGMAISFVVKIKSGAYLDAIFEEVTWWVVFAGIGLAVLGVTNLVIILGGILVVAGPLITGTGMGKITGIFGSLYNHVTGFFGDILSYSRLMALMLAGSVIAQVFNTLGAIPGNVFIFLVISFAGNTLNFALNLLGCYVHDLRLQCLEYFGKFYQDGGKPFRPLGMDTKYYNIVK